MKKINLTELLEAIEFHSDELQSFINLKTGEICLISEEANHLAENDDNSYLEWQKEDVKRAKHYLKNSDDYLSLPSQYDANEYQMMGDFVSNLNDEKIANQLLICLRGKG